MYVCLGANLPPGLLAEWLGSFTCHCGNTGVERRLNKSQHTMLTLEKKNLPPHLPGFELTIFRLQVLRSTNKLTWHPVACMGTVKLGTQCCERWILSSCSEPALSSSSQNFCLSRFWQLFRSKEKKKKGWLGKSDCYVFHINEEKLHHFRLTQFSVWHRFKCNIFSLDLLKTYAIFLHQDKQLSWRFFLPLNEICSFDTPKLATFLTSLCFWMCDVIFIPRQASFQTILYLEQDMQFLSRGCLAFSRYPINK